MSDNAESKRKDKHCKENLYKSDEKTSKNKTFIQCKEITPFSGDVKPPSTYPTSAWESLCKKKRLRECATDSGAQKELDSLVHQQYLYYHQKEKHHEALLFLTKEWYNYYIKKDINKAEIVLEKELLPYGKMHNVNTWCFDSMCHLREAYALAHKLKIYETLRTIESLLDDKTFSGTNIGKHYIFYCIGTCLVSVLKLDYKSTAFKMFCNECFLRFPYHNFTKKYFGPYADLNKMRDLAIWFFSKIT